MPPPNRRLQSASTTLSSGPSSRTTTNNSNITATPGNRSSQNPHQLRYQPPSHLPLNPAYGRKLETLAASAASENSAIRQTIQDALKILTDAAGDLAERVPPTELGGDDVSGVKKEEEGEGEGEGEDAEEKQVKKGQRILVQLEAAARELVDRSWEVDRQGVVMKEQVVKKGTKTNNPNEEEDPDDPSNRKGLWGLHGKEMLKLKQQRQTRSLKDRYTNVAEYVDFRRVVWGSQHPGGEPMPPAKQWFPKVQDGKSRREGTSSTASSPDGTQRPEGEGEDSDSDLELQATKTSDVCPLTLRPFTTPYTSTTCPHTFEKSAIMDMISKSSEYRQVGTDGAGMSRNPRRQEPMGELEKCVKCPVAGCVKWISTRVLREDKVVLRRMRLERERRERQGVEGGDAGGKGKGREGGGRGESQGAEVGEESFVDADVTMNDG